MVDNFIRAQDTKTSHELLAVLAFGEDQRIALAAVQNPSIPTWALQQVIEKSNQTELVAVAKEHPNWAPLVSEKVSSISDLQSHVSPPCTWTDPQTGVPYVWLNVDQVQIPRGTIGVRIYCFIFDLVLAAIMGFIVALLPSFLAVITGNDEFWGPVVTVTFVVGFLGYFAVSYRIWGRTISMRLGDLLIVNKATGEYLSWGRSIVRALVLILYLPVPFGWIIWWAVAGNSEWRQGPHDFAASSIVVVKK